MRTASLSVCVTLLAAAASADCNCGPDFCQGDPRYPPLLDTKKQALRADGYPEALVSLLDRDGACVARVERSPDGFSALYVDGNTRETLPWDEDSDRIGRERLLAGDLDAFYVFNVARAFACCEEPEATDRPDWDAGLGISRNLAIACTVAGSTITCR